MVVGECAWRRLRRRCACVRGSGCRRVWLRVVVVLLVVCGWPAFASLPALLVRGSVLVGRVGCAASESVCVPGGVGVGQRCARARAGFARVLFQGVVLALGAPRWISRKIWGLISQRRIFAALPRRLGAGGRAPPAVSEEGSRGASSRAGPGQGPGRCRAKGSQPKAVQAVSGGFGVIRASRLYLSWSRKRLMCVMISFQSRSIWRSGSLRLASRSYFVMGAT